MIHPRDHDRVMAQAAMTMTEKKEIEIEYRIVWHDGSVHWILDKARTIYSDSDKPLRMVGVNMDITERRRTEEMLNLHEIRLKDMLELHRLAGATEKEIFDFTLEANLRAVQSDFAFIGLMTVDETAMISPAWSKKVMLQGQISEEPDEFPLSQAGLWGEVVRQRCPVIDNDYEISKGLKKGYPQGHVPIKRLLGIPIFSGSRIVAVTCAANKACDYTESDVSAKFVL